MYNIKDLRSYTFQVIPTKPTKQPGHTWKTRDEQFPTPSSFVLHRSSSPRMFGKALVFKPSDLGSIHASKIYDSRRRGRWKQQQQQQPPSRILPPRLLLARLLPSTKTGIQAPIGFMRLGIWVLNQKRGTPKWMVKIMENPIKVDDLGVPLFLETPIFTCT